MEAMPSLTGTPTEFELDQWEREARQLAICTACFGSGESRWNLGRACKVCDGKGRAEREPHVLRLIAEVRQWRAGTVR